MEWCDCQCCVSFLFPFWTNSSLSIIIRATCTTVLIQNNTTKGTLHFLFSYHLSLSLSLFVLFGSFPSEQSSPVFDSFGLDYIYNKTRNKTRNKLVDHANNIHAERDRRRTNRKWIRFILQLLFFVILCIYSSLRFALFGKYLLEWYDHVSELLGTCRRTSDCFKWIISDRKWLVNKIEPSSYSIIA